MKQKLLDVGLIAIIIILVLLLLRTCDKKDAFEKINEQAKDSALHYRNKLGQQVTSITILEGSVKDLKKLNSKNDSTLKKLQELVDKKTTSATVLGNVTTNKGSGKTIVTFSTTVKHDTLRTPCDTVFPTYTSEWKDRWSQGKIVANKDSITRDFKLFNEFAIVEKYEREKFWKEKTPKIFITNLNPSTTTTEIKTFRVGKPKSRRGFVFAVGIGAGVGTILLINSLNK